MQHLNQCPEQIMIEELTQRRLLNRVGEALAQVPNSLEQAFSWQQAVAAQMALQGKPVMGWKCGLPSPERWVLAPIYQLHTRAAIPLPSKAPQALVEPEFAWRLSRDLPPGQPLNPDALRQAVQCHMALEIIFDRFEAGAAVDYHSRLADGLLNQAVWLGPPLPQAPKRLALAWHSAAEQVEAQGVHPTGDAFAPLAWLVGFLHQRGIGLCAGQVIITGSLNGLWRLPVNQPVSIEFGELAQVQVEFATELCLA